jgi:hypothetical protein
VVAERGASGANALKLPNDRYGLAFVFRVFDRVSYALVMNINKPVNTLDLVQNPSQRISPARRLPTERAAAMTPDPGLAGWLQLSLTPGLGAATLRGLLSKFGLPENILAAGRAELARHASAEALRALESEAVALAVAKALVWLEQPGNAVVTLADAAYPRLLLEIADPPALLYCRGRVELLNRPALAVVQPLPASPHRRR